VSARLDSARLDALFRLAECAQTSKASWAIVLADTLLASDGTAGTIDFLKRSYLVARQYAAFAATVKDIELYGVFPHRVTSERIHATFGGGAAVSP
jgi:hypothetical protein